MEGQPYHNQSLFSEYYLQELVRDDEFWQASLAQAPGIWEKLSALYRKVAPRLPGANEAETERLFIRPVLDTLGHLYALQPTLPSPEGPRRPDFAFFATEEDLREAEHLFKGKVEFFKTALAVGDAKHWDRSLDKKLKGPGDPFTNQNPSYQIDYYLRVTNCRWGILTNGRLWRLYNRDTSYRFDVYYEINLPALLEQEPFEAKAFTYFVAFFRKEAFVKGPGEECFLDRAYRGSVDYAAKLGEELKDNVYEALRLLAEGLLKYPPNHLSPDDDLDRIRENAFVLIYRILFTLYAEDRGLLPITHPDYHSYSLKKLAHEVAEKLDRQAPLAPTTLRYWSWLTDLFRIINEGDPYLGVPPYNGGLFDDEKHPFLKQYKIGDSYLAQAIDYLTRAKASGRLGRGFVSYRDLEIRHLGSIYEGLLEHRLRVAPEDIAVVKEDKAERFVPLAEVGKRKALQTYQAGQVYLETDKGERKATGSYYTPDYIVKYIVQHTLGPVLEEKTKLAKEQAEARRPELESLKKSIAAYKAQMAKAATPSLRKSYEEKIKAEEEKLKKLEAGHNPSSLLIEEILKVKVLDPAIGSGHFLVEATDYLARALIEAMGGSPTLEEEDIRWARREVVEKCIYGVDLNPLAMELAKLSLWLYTVARNRPLNFLDHHLRCGNSLIGVLIKDLGHLPLQARKSKAAKLEAAGQISTLEHVFREKVHLLLRSFELIETLPSETVEQIKQKDAYYQDFRKQVQRFKEVADLWTSLYFGNEVTWDEYCLLQEKIRALDEEWEELWRKPWFTKGLRLAEEKRFFHWELEFPEVFYEGVQEKENPGFDVVVGNPPYVNANELNRVLSEFEKPFWKTRFQSASGAYDLYILFLEQAINLVRSGGLSALITPNKFLSAPYAIAFREHVCSRAQFARLFNISRFRVFEDPAIYPVISIIQNLSPTNEYPITVETPRVPQSPLEVFVSEHSSSSLAKLPDMIWGVLISDRLPLVLKAEKVSTQLQHCSIVHASSTTAEADAYEDALSNVAVGNYKRFINTGIIDRYATLWGIEPLTHKGRVFMTPYLRLDHPVVSSERKVQYDKPKIVFAKMALRIEAFLDKHGEYASANTNFSYDSEYDLRYMMALLNSNFMAVLYREYFGALMMSGGYFQFQAPQLRVLPIRRIPFTTLANERARLLEKGKTLYERCLAKHDQACVLGFVEHCLAQEPEQADVVHDLLAFLAEQMIELNKQKHEEIKGFLGWLKREIGAKINDLKQKTKIKVYYEGTFEDLLEALKENRKALAVNPSQKAFQDRLKPEFEGSLAKLQPLKERLALTDRLIDQIVYRLYGLREEEIRIVEGAI